ncbi:MAG: YajD family HNH nuclease [Candidatus Hydrogenedentes bacterium]|nr:YajD family HNH nuclease [Candidatus Hydrogenedentota bacterium]
MPPERRNPDPRKRAEILAEVQRTREQREKGYREQALRLFPHVCARCGREFSGRSLRELTVHHRDGDHLNNPPDGSNWELLCLYCHDYEHQTPYQHAPGAGSPLNAGVEPLTFQAFESLKDLLPPGPPEPDADSRQDA